MPWHEITSCSHVGWDEKKEKKKRRKKKELLRHPTIARTMCSSPLSVSGPCRYCISYPRLSLTASASLTPSPAAWWVAGSCAQGGMGERTEVRKPAAEASYQICVGGHLSRPYLTHRQTDEEYRSTSQAKQASCRYPARRFVFIVGGRGGMEVLQSRKEREGEKKKSGNSSDPGLQRHPSRE